MEETKRVEEILDNFFQDNLALNIDNQSYIYSYEKREMEDGTFKYFIIYENEVMNNEDMQESFDTPQEVINFLNGFPMFSANGKVKI